MSAVMVRAAWSTRSPMTSRRIIRHQLLRPPRGVRLVLGSDPGGTPVLVLGDGPKLERSLDDLVSNALKLSPDGDPCSAARAVPRRWARSGGGVPGTMGA